MDFIAFSSLGKKYDTFISRESVFPQSFHLAVWEDVTSEKKKWDISARSHYLWLFVKPPFFFFFFAANISMEGDENVKIGRNMVPMLYVTFIGLEKLDLILPNYTGLKKALVNAHSLF